MTKDPDWTDAAATPRFRILSIFVDTADPNNTWMDYEGFGDWEVAALLGYHKQEFITNNAMEFIQDEGEENE